MSGEAVVTVVEPPQTALVPQDLTRGYSVLQATSYAEAMSVAQLIAKSDFAPKDYKGKPENVMIAIDMGRALGFAPMQALQNIAVINGRPAVYGDGIIALAQGRGLLETFKESFEGDGDALKAIVILKRKGDSEEQREEFSVKDAKTAGLWGKSGPWSNYPRRMLQWRARGFAFRARFADLLLGLVMVEEAMDYPAIDTTAVRVEDTVRPIPDLLHEHWDQLSDEDKSTIEKGIAALQELPGALSPAQRLIKSNECFEKAETAGDGALAFIEWLRDEYVGRKLGKKRDHKTANNNEKPNSKKAKPASGPAEPAQESPAPTPVAETKAPVVAPNADEIF